MAACIGKTAYPGGPVVRFEIVDSFGVGEDLRRPGEYVVFRPQTEAWFAAIAANNRNILRGAEDARAAVAETQTIRNMLATIQNALSRMPGVDSAWRAQQTQAAGHLTYADQQLAALGGTLSQISSTLDSGVRNIGGSVPGDARAQGWAVSGEQGLTASQRAIEERTRAEARARVAPARALAQEGLATWQRIPFDVLRMRITRIGNITSIDVSGGLGADSMVTSSFWKNRTLPDAAARYLTAAYDALNRARQPLLYMANRTM